MDDNNQHDENQQQPEHHEGQDSQQHDDHNQGQGQDQHGQADDNAQPNPQLLDAKRRATEALVPLLGDLQTDAETKFNICMSTIRTTDNTGLIPLALESAMAIENKALKAQALVDLINEINYQQRPKQAA
jgi:hypothetical protein